MLVAPPLAAIEGFEMRTVPAVGGTGFQTVTSVPNGAGAPLSPDVAICADCLREFFDPAVPLPVHQLRQRGPRYTIIRSVPYDRPATTMACFPMCADCAREYADPADRRPAPAGSADRPAGNAPAGYEPR